MLTATSRSLILLAEDDTLTRVLLTRVLRRAGFAVLPVARADELLQAAFGLEPLLACVVLDLLLGGDDSSHLLPLLRTTVATAAGAGAPAAAAARGASGDETDPTARAPAPAGALPRQGRTGGPHPARRVPAILISVYPDLERAARQCGADAWLPKPVQPADLVATVRRLLGA